MLHIYKDDGTNDELHEEVLRYRHDYFVGELGWEPLRKPDGREIDEFDTPAAFHFALREDGKIKAYSRFVPTTEPHLLIKLFPELEGTPNDPRSPSVYEWTRSTGMPTEGDGFVWSDATKQINMAVVEWAERAGLTALTAQFHPVYLTAMLEMGFDVMPLAQTKRLHDEFAVPVIARLKEDTVATLRDLYGFRSSVLPQDGVPYPEIGGRLPTGSS